MERTVTVREQDTGPRSRAVLHPGDQTGLLLLRLGLGGVLVWFGAAELHDPSSWAVFVPKMFDPVQAPLMFVHATALLVTGALLFAGMFHRVAAWLGGLILLAILGALAMTGAIDSVFVRDVGLACAAFALALSPTAAQLPGVDRWLAHRPRRGYAVPAVSYAILLAAVVGVLAATAVPTSGSSTALSNLGGAGGLSSLGGSPAGGASSTGSGTGLGGAALGGSSGAGAASGSTSTSGSRSPSSASSASAAPGASASSSTGLASLGAPGPSGSGH
ncbi:MAG: hypothetical protein P8Y13_03535 [Deinococcales bacterium]